MSSCWGKEVKKKVILKRYKKILWGGGNVLYYDCGFSCIGRYNCENLLDYLFKI